VAARYRIHLLALSQQVNAPEVELVTGVHLLNNNLNPGTRISGLVSFTLNGSNKKFFTRWSVS
jgi:hypothetical protein